jgi:lambda family phage portal protein
MNAFARVLRTFGLSRQRARAMTRRFDGAAGGRRWEGTPRFGSTGPETLAAAPILRSRARYWAANNPWVSNGVAALVDSLIGAGITPAAAHPNAAIRAALDDAFAAWATLADFDGLTDFGGLQAQIARGLVVDGEAFVHVINGEDGPQLQLIPPELVDESMTRDLGDGACIVAGVEFNGSGQRVAYHILKARPADQFATAEPPVRILADNILHVFAPLGPGQVRGVSWLAPVVLRLQELDQLEDALLVGAKVAAMHAGFLTDLSAQAQSPYDGTQTGSVLESGLEPGTLKFLPPGVDIKFSTPTQAAQSVQFAQLQLRAIAAGLGVPEHLLTGDLSGANYSSLRAGLVAFRMRIERTQFHTLIPQFLRPVWRRLVRHMAVTGEIDARDLETNPAAFDADWYPPAMPWVDPLKDAQAAAEMVASGFMSRRQAVAELGYSVEKLDAEIAADRKRESELGLSFGGAPTRGNEPAGPRKPERDDAE